MASISVYLCLLCALLPVLALALPIVDPGVFVIQGIESCVDGEGYCMLGMDCTADIDFMAAESGQHCDGLVDAFTPSVQFTCCRYNERGKASSEAPTTEQSAFTIMDVEQFLQEEVPILDYQQNNEVPEDVDPESLINIVGVITDMTGVLGLVTEPYKLSVQSYTIAPPTTSTTTPRPTEGIKMDLNSSHASISLIDILSNLKITQAPASTTTTDAPETKTTQANEVTRTGDVDAVNAEDEEDKAGSTITTSSNVGTLPPSSTVTTSTGSESGDTQTSAEPTSPHAFTDVPTTVLYSTTTPPTLTTGKTAAVGEGNSRNTIVIER